MGKIRVQILKSTVNFQELKLFGRFCGNLLTQKTLITCLIFKLQSSFKLSLHFMFHAFQPRFKELILYPPPEISGDQMVTKITIYKMGSLLRGFCLSNTKTDGLWLKGIWTCYHCGGRPVTLRYWRWWIVWPCALSIMGTLNYLAMWNTCLPLKIKPCLIFREIQEDWIQ